MKSTKLVAFEGCDGAGKGTQIDLLKEALRRDGWSVKILREPGSTNISEQIRQVLLNNKNTDMDPLAELLLYMAARRQMLQQELIPNIQNGCWDLIVLDRYWPSSVAFQGGGRGLGIKLVCKITDIVCQEYLYPDSIIYLDVPAKEGTRRIKAAAKDGRELNRLDQEKADFHRKVRDTYLELGTIFRRTRKNFWWTIDGTLSIDKVHQQVFETVRIILER